ncbi:hypothetical protein vseg_004833 [Gypsophila vaccaria]
MVSIGSVIYVVGGQKLFPLAPDKRPPCDKKGIDHNGMSYLDLNSDQGWVEAPYFHDTLDTTPCVVAFGGKIYMFVDCAPHAGIYDPISNTWESLRPPHPSHTIFDITCPSAAVPDPDNNRILVNFGRMGRYFAYYPDESRWQRVVDYIPFCRRHVFADGLFYRYDPGMLDIMRVYDFSTRRWLKIEFTLEVPRRAVLTEFDDMFYLGNGLICLAAASVPDYISPSSTHADVYIAKIRFQRCTARPDHLVATPFLLRHILLTLLANLSSASCLSRDGAKNWSLLRSL